ncbi:MAG: GFA family protein [Pseudomonadota bacterium]
MKNLHTGGCVCGQIRFRTEGEPRRVSLCACRWCQKLTGSALGISVYFDREKIAFTKGKRKSFRLKSDANRWIEQEFCPDCGTPLTWTLEYWQDYRGIAGGTFDAPTFWYQPERLVFARSKPAWLTLPTTIEVCQAMPQKPPQE